MSESWEDFYIGGGYDVDGLDIGFCPGCGCDMRGEPPAALMCTDCVAEDGAA